MTRRNGDSRRATPRLPEGACASLAAALAVVLCGACRWLDEVRVGQTVFSPDSAMVARFYTISGGGAAGYVSERVAVNRRGEAFDAHAGGDVFVMNHGYRVTLRWVAPRRLVIDYPASADVYRKCPLANGVRIDYGDGRPKRDSAGTSAPERPPSQRSQGNGDDTSGSSPATNRDLTRGCW